MIFLKPLGKSGNLVICFSYRTISIEITRLELPYVPYYIGLSRILTMCPFVSTKVIRDALCPVFSSLSCVNPVFSLQLMYNFRDLFYKKILFFLTRFYITLFNRIFILQCYFWILVLQILDFGYYACDF